MDFCEGEQAGKEKDGVIASEFVLLLGDELIEVVVGFLHERKYTVSCP